MSNIKYLQIVYPILDKPFKLRGGAWNLKYTRKKMIFSVYKKLNLSTNDNVIIVMKHTSAKLRVTYTTLQVSLVLHKYTSSWTYWPQTEKIKMPMHIEKIIFDEDENKKINSYDPEYISNMTSTNLDDVYEIII